MPGQRLTNVIILYRGSGGSPQTFTDNVGHVVDFNGPTFTNERIEVTDGDSPSNSKEYLAARQDPGPVQFTLNMEPVSHEELFTDASASPPTVSTYRLQFSSETNDYFQGTAFVASLAASGNARGAPLGLALGLQPTVSWELFAT